jgi:hypothetical protein
MSILEGRQEFIRVFGAPAHADCGETQDSFVGWCEGWQGRAIYDVQRAARILARFADGIGRSGDGEELVRNALEEGGAVIAFR